MDFQRKLILNRQIWNSLLISHYIYFFVIIRNNSNIIIGIIFHLKRIYNETYLMNLTGILNFSEENLNLN